MALPHRVRASGTRKGHVPAKKPTPAPQVAKSVKATGSQKRNTNGRK